MRSVSFVSGDVLRLTGLMAVGIGIAWALQSLGFGFAWVLGAAAIAGAGAGLIGVSQTEIIARAAAGREPARRR